MATPVYAPYVGTYAQHQPYVTIDEFIAAPNGINLNEIVPNTDDNTNRAALAEILSQASSEADRFCHQTLAATSETWSGQLRIQADGTMLAAVPFDPVVAVTDFWYGSTPTNLQEATDLSQVAILSPKIIQLPVLVAPMWNRLYVQMTYVSGFHNSFLAAASAAAVTVLTVDNTLGIVPGMTLSIFDPINGQNEVVTVATTTPTTITLAQATQYGHPQGSRVTAMPPAIKRAVLLIAQSMIKSKLSQTIVIPGTNGQPTVQTTTNSQAKQDRGEAETALASFARWR